MRTSLREVGKKLFVLYNPWPSWRVSGRWIVDTPDAGKITATDDGGREILSYVPLPLVADFLSTTGQQFVSRPKPHCVFSVLMVNPNKLQVTDTMSSVRSSQINRVRNNASLIFGSEFPQDWFLSRFNRGSIQEFQKLLGAYMTTAGKKYPLFPPILFPDESQNKSDLFLNPVIVKVSTFFYRAPTTWYVDKT